MSSIFGAEGAQKDSKKQRGTASQDEKGADRLGRCRPPSEGTSLPGGAQGVHGSAGGRPELDRGAMEERGCEEAGDVARAWGAPSLQGRWWREPQILPLGCSGADGRGSEDSLRPSAAGRVTYSGTHDVSASSLVKGARRRQSSEAGCLLSGHDFPPALGFTDRSAARSALPDGSCPPARGGGSAGAVTEQQDLGHL